ncbi:hypothetical protein J5N97_016204 [Dioscorea zingiberensis]|uniref:TFIIS N-terminal domain-containing protein n=1 Tax=Dioscorea zingiberensis TaxID=325984 RepID=A0A9D5HF69_9LILI|nr:hypothetical protein J5N97_016204 [Dioscorea zingiberensis]
MTMEDFFTLTEMKNGLATSARVEELISVMQKQVDIVTNSTGDAARQWSTVAGTLAATDNKDCLQHFVQLNGVILLNQCLQEAMKCSDDAGDSSAEELVNALLGSLERLPIDNEKSIASGIGVTVEHLLGHKTCSIQERARILLDQWNSARVDDAGGQNKDIGEASLADEEKPSDDVTKGDVMPPTCPEGISSCKPKLEDEALGIVSAVDEHGSMYPDNTQLDKTCNVKISISHESSPGTALKSTDANVMSSDRSSLGSSHVSNSCLNNFARTGESSACPAMGIASTSTCNGIGGEINVVDESDNKFNDAVNGEKQMEVAVDAKEGSLCKEKCNTLSSDSSVQKPMKESIDNLDVKENSCISKDALSQVSEIGNHEPLKYPRNSNDCKENEHLPLDCQGLSNKERIKSEMDVLETNCQLKEAFRSEDDTVEVDGTSNLNVNDVDLKTVEGKLSGVTDGTSELELESGEIEPLEVARQVARKVEHEVVNYREPSSSSPEVSSGEIEAHTLVPSDSKEGQPVIEQEVNGQSIGNGVSDRASSPMEDGSKVSEDFIFDPERHEEDMASLKFVVVDKEPAGKVAVCRLDFDLNADVVDEENDCSMYPTNKNPVLLSAPKAVFASSKGNSGSPVTRLQFEGEMGWRGSAATSAFRPASSQRTPESSSGSKQKPTFLGIDLNVTNEDGEAANTILVKQLPHSSGFPSADSSIEVSSRRTERLNLDLNRLGDDEVSPYSSLNWRPHHLKADQSMSPSSSSSSRVPSMRDFDLNDNPSLVGVVGSQNLNKSSFSISRTDESSKLDDPCVTIMGSRMTVERKSYADEPSHQAFLGSGVNIGTNMASRTMLPYHMPATAYGYNGIGVETTIPVPSTIYGLHRTPYLVDSSGVKVIPQLLRTSGQNNTTSGAVHFGALSSWNRPECSEPALDLNSGMTSMESGSSQPASLKQFFGFYGEQATTSQPESSGMPLKRKEPESGWDSHQFSYKQVTSSWL